MEGVCAPTQETHLLENVPEKRWPDGIVWGQPRTQTGTCAQFLTTTFPSSADTMGHKVAALAWVDGENKSQGGLHQQYKASLQECEELAGLEPEFFQRS